MANNIFFTAFILFFTVNTYAATDVPIAPALGTAVSGDKLITADSSQPAGSRMRTIDFTGDIKNTFRGDGTFDSDFSEIQYNPAPPPAYSEGLTFYDSVKNAWSYYLDEPDVSINTGMELVVHVRNVSGSTIANGAVVYPAGGDSGEVTIGLADASVTAKSRIVGVATHSIENATNGYVTLKGEVGGLDTSMYSAGNILYASSTIPGALTTDTPTDGAYIVAVGVVKVVDATAGVIIVDSNVADLTVEVTDTNGFPSSERTGTTLSFVDVTRTFSITPAVTDFHYYIEGLKYEKTAAESVIITNVEGLHVIYYDGETLTSLANPNSGQVDSIIRTKALVSYLYWDVVNSGLIYFGDERHGIGMSPNTHSYLHFTRGAQYLNGLVLDTFDVDGSGTLATEAQFGVVAGAIIDEDLYTGISSITSTTGLPIYYLSGATGLMRRVTQAGYPVYATGSANGRAYYNEWTGTTWQLTEVPNNDFVLYHAFAINSISSEPQVVSVMGQGVYSNIVQARAGANDEISSILSRFPFEEIVPLGTVIYQTNTSYTNAVKSIVRSTDTGDDYVSWLTTELAQGASPTSHSNLAELDLAGVGVTWGHIDDQPQTVAGVKTFSSSPIVPTPTTDYQSAPKKYVDDTAALPVGVEGQVVGYDSNNDPAAVTPVPLIAGTNVTFDDTTTPGSLIINSTRGLITAIDPIYRDSACTVGAFFYSADYLTRYDCVNTDTWFTAYILTDNLTNTPTATPPTGYASATLSWNGDDGTLNTNAYNTAGEIVTGALTGATIVAGTDGNEFRWTGSDTIQRILWALPAFDTDKGTIWIDVNYAANPSANMEVAGVSYDADNFASLHRVNTGVDRVYHEGNGASDYGQGTTGVSTAVWHRMGISWDRTLDGGTLTIVNDSYDWTANVTTVGSKTLGAYTISPDFMHIGHYVNIVDPGTATGGDFRADNIYYISGVYKANHPVGANL